MFDGRGWSPPHSSQRVEGRADRHTTKWRRLAEALWQQLPGRSALEWADRDLTQGAPVRREEAATKSSFSGSGLRRIEVPMRLPGKVLGTFSICRTMEFRGIYVHRGR